MSNESSWHKQREEFNDLVNLWDKAVESGIFDSKESKQKPTSDFFGQSKAQDAGLSDDDSEYWNDVVSRSGEMFPDESMYLMEAAKKKAAENKAKKKAKKKVKNKTGLESEGGKPLNDLVKSSLEKDKKKLTNAEKADIVANQPQKVYPDTVGSDTTDKNGGVKVTAGLAVHQNLEKLVDLKKAYYKLETDMSDKDGLNEDKVKNLQDKMKKLEDDIEKLSNELHGKYSDSEYYN